MLRQQGQGLLWLASSLEHDAPYNQNTDLVSVRGGELLDRGDGGIRLAKGLLGQSAGGLELGLLGALDVGEHFLRLADCYAGAQDQEAGGQLIFGGKGRGVKVNDLLVLALVEVVVDIDQFALGGVRVHDCGRRGWRRRRVEAV